MGLFDGFRNRLVGFFQGVINDAYTSRANEIISRREYRLGIQRRQLRVRSGQADDNLVMNFTGLAVDRGVSMLFGEPPEFEYDRGTEEDAQASPQEQFVDDTWEANNKAILLHKLALNGSESGDCYIKFQPDGVNHNGKQYTRLIALDPAFLDIGCDPDDMEKIIRFVIQYKTVIDGKEVGKREITQWTPTSETDPAQGYWLITHEISTNGKWQSDPNIPDVNWEFDFAPILHWQNLPNPNDVYGTPDITPDVVELQDRLNFVASNMSKIIRLYAHPQRYSRFFNRVDLAASLGPDDMPNFNHEKGAIEQLDPVADLEASRLFMLNVRQSLFDLTRTVDITSIADKLGTLTNFGLHVLYQDATSKLETKHSLYGWALREINRRLLILNGEENPPECQVVWQNPLPENIVEESQVDESQIGMKIVSPQTISERRGYDWAKEQERMAAAKQGESNLGDVLLSAFNKGQ